MGFPWNGNDAECTVGTVMGMGIKAWEHYVNGNDFPLHLFSTTTIIAID